MGRMRKSLGRRIDSMAKWFLKFRLVSLPARAIANSSYAWSFISRTDRIRTNRLRERLKESDLPQHISIIMDGNRRFAWNKEIGRDLGHRHGKEKLKEVMDWIIDLEVPYLTVYALSTENINERAPEELEALYDLYVTGLNEIAEDPRIHERGVKVQAMGRLEMLPERVREAIGDTQSRTEDYTCAGETRKPMCTRAVWSSPASMNPEPSVSYLSKAMRCARSHRTTPRASSLSNRSTRSRSPAGCTQPTCPTRIW